MGVGGIWDSSDGQSWPRNTHPDYCAVYEAAPPPNSLPSLTLVAQSPQPWYNPPDLPAPLPIALAEDILANVLQGQSCLGLCLSEDMDSQSRGKRIVGFITSRKAHLVFQGSETLSKLVKGHKGRSVASPPLKQGAKQSHIFQGIEQNTSDNVKKKLAPGRKHLKNDYILTLLFCEGMFLSNRNTYK